MMRRPNDCRVMWLLALGLAGCEPMARDNVGVNCAAESEVEYAIPPAAQQEDRTVMTPFGLLWETAGEEPGFFCFGDPSPNAYPTTAPWPSTAGCPSPMVEALEAGSEAAPF